jgi:hypothetical protein
MLGKIIAIIGIIGFTSIAFFVALITSSVSNQALTQIDETLQPIVKDNPQAKASWETGKSLEEIDGISSDVKTLQTSPTKGLKNMTFVFPLAVLLAGGILIFKKLQSG